MSIFQHTFDPYVRNQLKLRQAILKQGNVTSDKLSKKFNTPEINKFLEGKNLT